MAFLRITASGHPDEYPKGKRTVLEDQSVAGVREFAKANGIAVMPLDVERLAESLGLQVNYVAMDDDLSGILEKTPAGWHVLINSFHHPLRRRFTLAHEVAHYLLHGSERDKFEDLLFARRASLNDQMEREADRFAAELLMPEAEFREFVAQGVKKLSELSERFGTSIAAVKYRADQIGLRRKKRAP